MLYWISHGQDRKVNLKYSIMWGWKGEVYDAVLIKKIRNWIDSKCKARITWQITSYNVWKEANTMEHYVSIKYQSPLLSWGTICVGWSQRTKIIAIKCYSINFLSKWSKTFWNIVDNLLGKNLLHSAPYLNLVNVL